MRKLPIFFLLDVSESMVGVPLNSLEEGMERIISSLRQDPSALETVFISVIAFAGKAKVISPLIDIVSFYPPRLPIGGGTSLGLALETLMKEIDTKVVLQSSNRQGDWKPLVFLITDGKPTDNTTNSIKRWKEKYSHSATMVAITLGYNADTTLLKKLTPHVLVYEGSSSDDFKVFFDWISNSVKSHSQAIEQGQEREGINLSKAGDKIKKISENLSNIDQSSIILTGRCQSNKRPYLVKYERAISESILKKYDQRNRFILDGAYHIPEDYFEWSIENTIQEVNVSELEGVPSCPHCSSLSSIGACGFCQKIMCVSGEGTAICPWCKEKNNFIFSDTDFTIQRGEG